MAGTTLKLEFDEATHQYRLNGVVLPSVTQILEDDGQMVPSYPSGPYRFRGSQVHKATHLWETGVDLNAYDIGADILPYVQSYIGAMQDFQEDWLLCEHRMAHLQLCYAGTADRIGKRPLVADLKTGKTGRETGVQLAGYVLLALEDPEIRKAWGNVRPEQVERVKFELQKDGSPAVVSRYTDALDFEVFRGLLAKYVWKRRKG